MPSGPEDDLGELAEIMQRADEPRPLKISKESEKPEEKGAPQSDPTPVRDMQVEKMCEEILYCLKKDKIRPVRKLHKDLFLMGVKGLRLFKSEIAVITDFYVENNIYAKYWHGK